MALTPIHKGLLVPWRACTFWCHVRSTFTPSMSNTSRASSHCKQGTCLEDGFDAEVEGRAGALARAELLCYLRAHLTGRHVCAQRLCIARRQIARSIALRKVQRLPVPVSLCGQEDLIRLVMLP